jgi:uncharacterized membrane protein (UPF0127 family)
MTINVAAVAGLVLAATGFASAQWAAPRGEVIFPDATRVVVEIADTATLRQQGLMHRERLAPNEGMVFLFDQKGFYPFWMKHTLIPLDMIWLDEHRRIVSIAHSVPPCKADPCPSFSPTADALFVVEVVSGFARRHGLKEGDQVVFRGIGKARAGG